MKESDKQHMGEHPNYQDIVLIGGGHSHAVFLQLWAKKPLPGVRLTLVSPQVQSAYSGMLPGMIAGHYGFSDIHIDLPRLCRAAGARFVQACAHHIDPVEKRVSLLGRPDLEYDLISLDVGATPCRKIPGSDLAIPVKPVGHFHRYWQQLKHQVHGEHQPLRLGIVGGGLGGCELAMAMSWALEEQIYSGRVEIHLLHAGNRLPEEYALLARRMVARELGRLKIRTHRNWRVAEITHRGVHNDEGEFLALDKVLLCTEAGAPPWLAQSGLALDDGGFVQVDAFLRTVQHPSVFAAGDVASPLTADKTEHSTSRSARNALDQGPVLYHNLRATLLEQPLKPYRATKRFFSLLSCGSQRAIAARGGFSCAGRLLWLWKDHRDRQLMRRFESLPVAGIKPQRALAAPALSALWHNLVPRAPHGLEQRDNISIAGLRNCDTTAVRGTELLDRTLSSLPQPQPIASTLARGNEAAVIKLPSGKLLAQSSDQLRAPVADPWLFGRLSALHALSSLISTQVQPHTAQALVTLPHGAPELAARDLQQLLDGAARELNQHNCALNGGSTTEGPALQLGLTINGVTEPGQPDARAELQAGDCLILTKPLGIGTLLAAERQGKAHGRWIQQALELMLQSNATAADIFASNDAHAISTINDAGLLGRLLEILQYQGHHTSHHRSHPADLEQSNHPSELRLGASLFADALPLLPGATYCAEHGLLAHLHSHNARSYTALQNPAAWRAKPLLPLLVDPQICGGLLGAVPVEFAEDCLTALQASGCRHAAIIGVVDELPTSSDQLLCAPQPIHLAQGGDWKKLARRHSELIS
ncbi:selenide, water dikinase SelD [uncultured Microbulbifer sp.]|uniref:selenide, water dikinase SelD n=1 Tax=uncultured Microbulbifer sp. TaxID=348147 RepID=UPI00262ABEAE|nr:selenide, water dikinase SelD [uncultured Microbulbifer sp.]